MDQETAATHEQISAEVPQTGAERWQDQVDYREWLSKANGSKAALGAAVGIGSAALLAALLWQRRGRSEG